MEQDKYELNFIANGFDSDEDNVIEKNGIAMSAYELIEDIHKLQKEIRQLNKGLYKYHGNY